MLHVLHSQFTMVCDIDLNPDSIFSSGVCPFSTLHGPSASDSDLFFFWPHSKFSKLYIYRVLPSDLFGCFKWPFQVLRDLYLGDQKVTWKKLEYRFKVGVHHPQTSAPVMEPWWNYSVGGLWPSNTHRENMGKCCYPWDGTLINFNNLMRVKQVKGTIPRLPTFSLWNKGTYASALQDIHMSFITTMPSHWYRHHPTTQQGFVQRTT